MLISIITATYNSSGSIAHAIKSLNAQSYEKMEHIVIDGASEDETLNIIHSLKKKDTKIVSEPDDGIYDALNKGIQIAMGDIIGFLHSDDFFMKEDVIQTIVDRFINESADMVYGDILYVSKKNPQKIIRTWKSGDFKSTSLKYGWMPPHPAVFMKRDIYEKYGNFDLNFKISSDYEHMIRILKNKNLTISYLPETITCMKVGGESNRSLKNIKNKMTEDYAIIIKHKIGGIYTLMLKNIRKLNQFL